MGSFYFCINCKYLKPVSHMCGVRHIHITNPSTACCQYYKQRERKVITVNFDKEDTKDV